MDARQTRAMSISKWRTDFSDVLAVLVIDYALVALRRGALRDVGGRLSVYG
jgi:hypothetical protein